MNVTQPADGLADKETGRLEAFSDGVFSIAMTLLVLELRVPTLTGAPTTHAVWIALAKQWPSYLAFLTSFFTVLIMWVNHHGIFRLIRRSNAQLMFANGFLLLLVTAVPFPTALVAAYLKTPAAGVACTVYGGTFVLVSISYALLVLVASRNNGRLLVVGSEAEMKRRLRDCYLVGFPLYLLAAVVGSFTPWLSLAICTGLWVFWSVGSVERGSAFGR